MIVKVDKPFRPNSVKSVDDDDRTFAFLIRKLQSFLWEDMLKKFKFKLMFLDYNLNLL